MHLSTKSCNQFTLLSYYLKQITFTKKTKTSRLLTNWISNINRFPKKRERCHSLTFEGNSKCRWITIIHILLAKSYLYILLLHIGFINFTVFLWSLDHTIQFWNSMLYMKIIQTFFLGDMINTLLPISDLITVISIACVCVFEAQKSHLTRKS